MLSGRTSFGFLAMSVASMLTSAVFESPAGARSIAPLPSNSPIALASGFRSACLLQAGGKIYCWGDNSSGQLGNPWSESNFFGTYEATAHPVLQNLDFSELTGAIAITMGNRHGCAITSDGKVMCWGANDRGQLGIGLADSPISPRAAVYVEGLGGSANVLGSPQPKAIAIAAGTSHTCALLDTQQVACWGDNEFEQAGQPYPACTPDCAPEELVLVAPAIVNISASLVPFADGAIVAGATHTCVLTRDFGGLPVCWGSNEFGQLGRNVVASGAGPSSLYFPDLPNYSVPQLTDTDGGLTRLASNANASDTCVLSGVGRVYCWGYDDYRQLGVAISGGQSNQPQWSTSGASGIAVGQDDACAILSSGRLQCWGLNNSGQLGFVSANPSSTYPPVMGPIASYVDAISMGLDFVCAIVNYTSVQCWGSNVSGSLGRGVEPAALLSSPIPAAVQLSQ